MSIYMAAWNSTNVDDGLMYSGSMVKRKQDARGRAECSKVEFATWLHCCSSYPPKPHDDFERLRAVAGQKNP